MRYDPRDMGEIRVFYQDKFLCRAISADLADEVVPAREIVRARKQRCHDLRKALSDPQQRPVRGPLVESADAGLSFVEEHIISGNNMPSAPVTRLLQESRNGSKEAFDQLVPHVYDKLRQLAAGSLRAEGASHTARATSLVHEAYLRLVGADVDWQNRMHFYAVAAQVMRRAGRRRQPSTWG